MSIFQKAALWVNDFNAMPVEMAKPLYEAGDRVIVCQLQDKGEVPRTRVDQWRELGFFVGGAVRPSGAPLYESGKVWTPEEVAYFCSGEKRRLGLHIMHFNFEDEIEALDMGSGSWSELFVSEWRKLRPRMASCLTTYTGAKGMNLDAYRQANFRLVVETFDEFSLWADPPTSFVQWAGARGWPKAKVKPCFGVHTLDGQRMDIDTEVASAKQAGTLGFTAYPADAAPNEYLVELVTKAIAGGIVR